MRGTCQPGGTDASSSSGWGGKRARSPTSKYSTTHPYQRQRPRPGTVPPLLRNGVRRSPPPPSASAGADDRAPSTPPPFPSMDASALRLLPPPPPPVLFFFVVPPSPSPAFPFFLLLLPPPSSPPPAVRPCSPRPNDGKFIFSSLLLPLLPLASSTCALTYISSKFRSLPPRTYQTSTPSKQMMLRFGILRT